MVGDGEVVASGRKLARARPPVICHDGPLGRRARADIVRRIRAGSRGLSHADQQFLTDFDAGRYPMKGLDRLVDLHVRAITDEGAHALADTLALLITERRRQGSLSFLEASVAEQEADGAVDVLQVAAPTCPTKRRQLAERIQVQMRRLRELAAACLLMVLIALPGAAQPLATQASTLPYPAWRRQLRWDRGFDAAWTCGASLLDRTATGAP